MSRVAHLVRSCCCDVLLAVCCVATLECLVLRGLNVKFYCGYRYYGYRYYGYHCYDFHRAHSLLRAETKQEMQQEQVEA